MRQEALRAKIGAALCTLALIIAFVAPANGETIGKGTTTGPRADKASDIVVSDTQIQLFKYALALRPEQERYWIPVEAALRNLGQKPSEAGVQRASLRPGKGNDPQAKYKRLSAAAVPLIKTFDDNQRRNLEVLSRTFGFERWLAAH
jgi:hypothetical protein